MRRRASKTPSRVGLLLARLGNPLRIEVPLLARAHERLAASLEASPTAPNFLGLAEVDPTLVGDRLRQYLE